MCGDYNLRREKRYVEVDVRFTPDGKIRPLAINYDKTRTYGIDRVLAVKHGTSRFGVKGHCFTCLICGQKRNLWLEKGKWFVEAYCSVPESRASWKPTVPHQKVGLHNGKILIACRTFVHSRQIY